MSNDVNKLIVMWKKTINESTPEELVVKIIPVLKVLKEIMPYEYPLAKECQNTEEKRTCFKCGRCGREFVYGIMIDDGGTTIEESENNGKI